MKNNFKESIKKIPLIGTLTILLNKKIRTYTFSSKLYWENRYKSGGNSGVGSYDKFAEFKAEIINQFVESKNIKSIIEFGSGDGNQLKFLNFKSYIGFDISDTCIQNCRELYRTDPAKQFKNLKEYEQEQAELTLSLDVIFHLIEDRIYFNYMKKLFSSSNKYVIIYSSNFDDKKYKAGYHVKHREFTKWIEQKAPSFKLIEHIPNKYPYNGDYTTTSFADFYIFENEINKTTNNNL